MKRLISFVAAAGLFVLLFSLSPTGSAKACGGRWGCADPELCVNSQLLTITPSPSVGGNAYVMAPASADVDFNVVNCGGTQDPLAQSHFFTGGRNKLVVTVLTDPRAPVTITYGDQSVTRSNSLGVVVVAFNLN